jgi:hypothetical protein
VDEGLDQLTAVQLIVAVGVVHLEVVELQLLEKSSQKISNIKYFTEFD